MIRIVLFLSFYCIVYSLIFQMYLTCDSDIYSNEAYLLLYKKCEFISKWFLNTTEPEIIRAYNHTYLTFSSVVTVFYHASSWNKCNQIELVEHTWEIVKIMTAFSQHVDTWTKLFQFQLQLQCLRVKVDVHSSQWRP